MRKTTNFVFYVLNLVVLMAVSTLNAGILPPLYVGNTSPVKDQYGRAMNRESLVELRKATDGIIRPPTINGEAHPKNPLVSTNSFCNVGLNSISPDSGLFCIIFPYRPEQGMKIFARAYSLHMDKALFYADTAIGVAPPNYESSLALNFLPSKPIDPKDDDLDGLNNSWEQLLGTYEKLTNDYDGDGMLDYHEMLAGTDPTDSESNLSLNSINSEFGANKKYISVKWLSTPGKQYQIQYAPMIDGEQVFIDVGEEVLADAGEFEKEMLLDIPENAVKGYFRVKLITWDDE